MTFKILKTIFYIIPWILSITSLHQFLYNKYPKYYFFIVKHFKKWRDTKWKLSASYRIKKSYDFFNQLESSIDNVYKNKTRIFNLKNKKQYDFSDYNLTVQYDLDVSQTEYVTVELLFGNITATHNTSKKKLETLRKFFYDIEKNIEVIDTNYNLNIFFTGVKNPFYGLMIQRLGEKNVQYFECRFPITELTKENEFGSEDNSEMYLTVYKDLISINNSSFDTIEEIAKKCLVLE